MVSVMAVNNEMDQSNLFQAISDLYNEPTISFHVEAAHENEPRLAVPVVR